MTQVSHRIVISGMGRCTDSAISVTSSIFLNFNVNIIDALDVLYPLPRHPSISSLLPNGRLASLLEKILMGHRTRYVCTL